MKFWILLVAVVGYHIQDAWDFLLVWAKFRPEYPVTIFVLITCPGWVFFRSHFLVGLTNALIYGVVAYAITLAVKKLRQLRGNLA